MNKTTYATPLVLIFLSTAASADVKTLCESKENNLWSCQSGAKIYSVCASKDLADTLGYLQYRAGTTKGSDFRFPASLLHPKGRFEFNLLARGVSLTFSNGGYDYTVIEDIKGKTEIVVEKSSRMLTTIHCRDSTGTLADNSTIDLFKSAGIFK